MLIDVLPIFSSCMLYVPIPWTIKDRLPEERTTITPGVSTKEDVHEKLGEPDILYWYDKNTYDIDEHVYVYILTRHRGTILLYIGVSAGPGEMGVIPVETYKALIILFDDADRVKRIGIVSKHARESYHDLVMQWLKNDIKTPQKEVVKVVVTLRRWLKNDIKTPGN